MKRFPWSAAVAGCSMHRMASSTVASSPPGGATTCTPIGSPGCRDRWQPPPGGRDPARRGGPVSSLGPHPRHRDRSGGQIEEVGQQAGSGGEHEPGGGPWRRAGRAETGQTTASQPGRAVANRAASPPEPPAGRPDRRRLAGPVAISPRASIARPRSRASRGGRRPQPPREPGQPQQPGDGRHRPRPGQQPPDVGRPWAEMRPDESRRLRRRGSHRAGAPPCPWLADRVAASATPRRIAGEGRNRPACIPPAHPPDRRPSRARGNCRCADRPSRQRRARGRSATDRARKPARGRTSAGGAACRIRRPRPGIGRPGHDRGNPAGMGGLPQASGQIVTDSQRHHPGRHQGRITAARSARAAVSRPADGSCGRRRDCRSHGDTSPAARSPCRSDHAACLAKAARSPHLPHRLHLTRAGMPRVVCRPRNGKHSLTLSGTPARIPRGGRRPPPPRRLPRPTATGSVR